MLLKVKKQLVYQTNNIHSLHMAEFTMKFNQVTFYPFYWENSVFDQISCNIDTLLANCYHSYNTTLLRLSVGCTWRYAYVALTVLCCVKDKYFIFLMLSALFCSLSVHVLVPQSKENFKFTTQHPARISAQWK